MCIPYVRECCCQSYLPHLSNNSKATLFTHLIAIYIVDICLVICSHSLIRFQTTFDALHSKKSQMPIRFIHTITHNTTLGYVKKGQAINSFQMLLNSQPQANWKTKRNKGPPNFLKQRSNGESLLFGTNSQISCHVKYSA